MTQVEGIQLPMQADPRRSYDQLPESPVTARLIVNGLTGGSLYFNIKIPPHIKDPAAVVQWLADKLK